MLHFAAWGEGRGEGQPLVAKPGGEAHISEDVTSPSLEGYAAMTATERQQEIERLYRQAFEQFGPIALWNVRRFENPTPEQALAITRQLRTEGNMDARRLAERIESVCRADH